MTWYTVHSTWQYLNNFWTKYHSFSFSTFFIKATKPLVIAPLPDSFAAAGSVSGGTTGVGDTGYTGWVEAPQPMGFRFGEAERES